MENETKVRGRISSVKHVSIPVRNQDKALAFYKEKLGFEVVVDAPFGEKQRWIEMKIPGADTLVVLFTPEGHENRIGTFSNIVFACEDIQATYESLKGQGVAFLHPPRKEPWGSFALFKDIDGNIFCLSSP